MDSSECVTDGVWNAGVVWLRNFAWTPCYSGLYIASCAPDNTWNDAECKMFRHDPILKSLLLIIGHPGKKLTVFNSNYYFVVGFQKL